jgi:hypothetical protein
VQLETDRGAPHSITSDDQPDGEVVMLAHRLQPQQTASGSTAMLQSLDGTQQQLAGTALGHHICKQADTARCQH